MKEWIYKGRRIILGEKNKLPFIATTDVETAQKLRELGYQELAKEGNRWMFLNDGVAVFDRLEKINFTNKLTF